MGFLFAILLPLFCIVSFVGFVWLVRNAFRTGTRWGVLVLLLSPVAAIVYALKHWQDSKTPFLIYAGSFMTACVLVLGLGGFAVMSMADGAGQVALEGSAGAEPHDGLEKTKRRGAKKQGMPEQERREPDDGQSASHETDETPQITLTVVDGTSVETATPAGETTAVAAAFDTRTWQGAVPLHKADRFVGQVVSVRTRGGTEYSARLTEAGKRELHFERELVSGKVTIYEKRADIESLRVAEN